MTAIHDIERWQRLEDLFHAALDRAPAERAAFLDEACSGDRELRDQVEKLLASFEESGDFIERPVLSDSLSGSAKESCPSESIIGQKFGNYEILSLLGTGGMGEVYLARDARLDRQIALKLLPQQFTQDIAQVRRFEREARAASALNHPNIITIHDIGQKDNTHFIATEYVRGHTLREIISSRKLDLGEAIATAIQIASALEAAHAAGIVHRDIKPENVMVRPDGLVKVLDFGLAKPVKSEVVTGSLKRADVGELQTDPRLLMGTLAYLSPEQARGGKFDHRTDIFSLGVVFYEMVAGARPFKRESAAATLDAILYQKPEPVAPVAPVAIEEANLYLELNRILSRALEKNAEARYRNGKEMRDALQRLARQVELQRGASAAEDSSDLPKSLNGWRVKAALVVAVIAAFAAAWLVWRRVAAEPKDASSPWIDAVSIKLTGYPGQEFFPSLAPDGQSFVYSRLVNQQFDIFSQYVGGATESNLTAGCDKSDWMPAYSPDGKHIAFRSDCDGGGIFLIDADGTNRKQLTSGGYNPTWSPDGQEIAYATELANSPHSRPMTKSKLMVVKVAAGKPREIETGTDSDAVQPSWSPSGERIAYWGLRGTNRDIWTVSASGGNTLAVTNDEATDWNPVWSPDGKYLYFASDIKGAMRFWRVRIDQATGRVLGEREAVTGAGAENWHPSFSRDGKRLAYVNYAVKENLQRVAFDPEKEVVTSAPSAITQGERRVTAPDLSPDGQWLIYYSFGSPQEDLFVVRTDGTQARRLTNDRPRDRVPRWSPNGKWIAFYSDRNGQYEIWTLKPDGHDLRQITHYDNANCFYPTWSPDGSQLGYYKAGVNTFILDFDIDKAWSEQTPQPLPRMPESVFGRGAHFSLWSWSPNGEMLAGFCHENGGNPPGICLYSLASHGYERLTENGSDPIWLNDNRRLLYVYKNGLYLIDRHTKKSHEILSLNPLRISLATLSHDNRQIFFSVISPESDIQMLSLN